MMNDPLLDVSILIQNSNDEGPKTVTRITQTFRDRMSPILWEYSPIEISKPEFVDGMIVLRTSSPQAGIPHEDWHFLHILVEVSRELDVLVHLTDPSIILTEVADLLPDWCNEDYSLNNRIFLLRGSVVLLVPSHLHRIQGVRESASYILTARDSRIFINKAITRRVSARLERREWLDMPLHVARVVIPRDFARLLQSFPQLISKLLQYIPVDPDINKALLKGEFVRLSFLSHSTEEEPVSAAIQFTRLQWAALRSFGDHEVLPAFRRQMRYNMAGRLLLSALCNLLKRGDPKSLMACFPSYERDQQSEESCTDLLLVILKSMNPSKTIDCIDHDTDESWLGELMNAIDSAANEPSSLNPLEFEKEVEDFIREDSDSSRSSYSEESELDESGSAAYEEDSDAGIFFDEMEKTIRELKISESADISSDMFESMDSEALGSVGPATALLAGILLNRRT